MAGFLCFFVVVAVIFVNQYKPEYVECCSTRSSCCSEFMRTPGGCPTGRGLRVKSPSVVMGSCGVGHLGDLGQPWECAEPFEKQTIGNAKLAACLTEWMWPYLSHPCSVSAKAKLKKFTFRVYDFHQGFLNISVGGRKANFLPTFCNDSYSLQYF